VSLLSRNAAELAKTAGVGSADSATSSGVY
jgi:hypothetical protein